MWTLSELLKRTGAPYASTLSGRVAAARLRQIRDPELANPFAEYREEPVRFIQEQYGITPTPGQCDVLEALVEHRRVALKGSHGEGKTAIGTWAGSWFLASRHDSRVPLTAPHFKRQIKEIFFTRLAEFYYSSQLLQEHFELLSTELRHRVFPQTWFMTGFSAKDPGKVEGFHPKAGGSLLYLVEEAKAIEEAIWTAIDGAMTGGDVHLFAFSVPGEQLGRFFKVFTSLRDRWKAFSLPACYDREKPAMEFKEDNWRRRLVKRADSLVSDQWIDDMAATYGIDHPIFRSKVKAEFADQEGGSLIPLSWIERCQRIDLTLLPCKECGGRVIVEDAGRQHCEECGASWKDRRRSKRWKNARLQLGLDVARQGDDRSAWVLSKGGKVVLIETAAKQDLMSTTGHTVGLVKQLRITSLRLDDTGLGGGVTDRIKELQFEDEKLNFFDVVPMNFGSAPHNGERFADLPSEMWWHLRELAQGAAMQLPEHEGLVAQLTGRRWKELSSSKIKIESKQDMKKRKVASPDIGDALALALYPEDWLSGADAALLG